jgi:hypothetical protein
VLVDQADGNALRGVVLVAEDDSRVLHGLVYGTHADDDLSGAAAEIRALGMCNVRGGRLRASASAVRSCRVDAVQVAA